MPKRKSLIDRLAQRAHDYADKLEEENRKQREPSLNDHARDILRNIRSLVCQDVAVVTIEDTKPTPRIVEKMSDEKTAMDRDQRITHVLGTVLKSNPTADLSVYEKSFSIKILKVEILKPDSRPRGGIYASS